MYIYCPCVCTCTLYIHVNTYMYTCIYVHIGTVAVHWDVLLLLLLAHRRPLELFHQLPPLVYTHRCTCNVHVYGVVSFPLSFYQSLPSTLPFFFQHSFPCTPPLPLLPSLFLPSHPLTLCLFLSSFLFISLYTHAHAHVHCILLPCPLSHPLTCTLSLSLPPSPSPTLSLTPGGSQRPGTGFLRPMLSVWKLR